MLNKKSAYTQGVRDGVESNRSRFAHIQEIKTSSVEHYVNGV